MRKLVLRWSKRERDWMVDYPSSPDGWLMHGFLKGDCTLPQLLTELQKRGYDTSTLRITIGKPEPDKGGM